MQSNSVYEIEVKALLTEEQYKKLYSELPKKMKKVNEETIHTTKYTPGDVRLRYSDKTFEIVCKEPNPVKLCRNEAVIPLSSKDELKRFAQVFELLNIKHDPSWVKHKSEFEYSFNGYTYMLSLQHIENFAYILEVEFLSETDNSLIHEPNLKRILSELGCEPIKPEEFSDKINKYIEENKAK